MSEPVQIFTAEAQVKRLDQVLKNMVRGMLQSRYVAYRLAKRDIKSQYVRSQFGLFWDFADPLVLGVVFYLLRQSNAFSTGDTGMPYALYILFGLLMYQTFVNATMESIGILGRSRGLVTQQKLPPEALLLSVFYRVGFMSLLRIAVMLLFALILGAYSIPGIVKFLVAFPVLILAGMAIGVFLAPFNVIYGDVGRFTGMILVPLRFVSPVFFVLPDTPAYNLFNALNPFALIMGNLRSLATSDTMSQTGPLIAHCGGLLVIGLVGWCIFHVSVPVLAERA